MKPIEIVYVALGIGIIVRGIIGGDMTATELSAGMFFLGLAPVNAADKAKTPAT